MSASADTQHAHVSHDVNGLVSAAQPPPPAERPTFEELYAGYFDFTWRLLRNLVGHRHRVDDAVQELWTVVHRRLGDFEQRSSIRTWLFGIALNVARNQRRAESKHAAVELLPEIVPSPNVDPETARETREIWRTLSRFVDALSEQDRAIFVSNVIEDLSARETAEALGVQVMIVYQRVRTLRRLAKNCLELHEQGNAG